MDSQPLHPQLDEAQQALAVALEEACATDLDGADTGELIRIEEKLEVATKAAKKAVSVRLKLGNSAQADKQPEPAGRNVAAPDAPAPTHRRFDDSRGKRWHAFAVHTSGDTVGRAGLPESFRLGWLVFDAADEVRRVAPIPEKWEDLSIDELRRLCDNAGSAPKRSTSGDLPKNPERNVKS